MKFPIRFWTALGGVLSTGVALLALLGPWSLTPEAQAAIIAFGNAVILTLTTLAGEGDVTPLADPRLVVGTTYKAITPEGDVATVNRVTV